MGEVRLTRAADADLDAIARHSAARWGTEQAAAYLHAMQHALETLADLPNAGRDASALRPGLRRLDHGRHAVFFRPRPGGILVIRVLHQRMLAALHL